MSASLDKSQSKPDTTKPEPPKPYFKPDGTLVIPFAAEPKFHWWNGGQSEQKTRENLRSEAGL